MNVLSGWHRDSGETVPGGYFNGDYYASGDCRVYKIALYLQDSTARSGLTVVPRSHRDRQVSTAGAIHLDSRAGDAIVFDVRLTHAGQLPDAVERGIMGLSLLARRVRRASNDPGFAYGLRQLYWRLTGKDDRLSIFYTFGAANQFTFDFASANLRRQAQQLGGTEGLTGSADGTALNRIAQQLSSAGVLTYGVNVGG
jgi:hypothetical protein